MLDPHTEHATQLRNHWYWRPGHRPGRPYYTWHLTFEGQHDLHRLVGEYQEALRDVPCLDIVPIPWLHLTVQGIGFADEVTDTDLDAIIETTRAKLANISSPTVTFHQVTIRPEAIALHPEPTELVNAVRYAIRQAIGDVWGASQVPEKATGYQPHLTIAYVNNGAESLCVLGTISALDAEPVQLAFRSTSCIALERVNHTYRWTTHTTADLMSENTAFPM